jgi:cytochrome c553
MHLKIWMIGCALAALPMVSLAADNGEISVERGRHVSIIGGCNDCHTANYTETGGQIDPALALKGTAIGWRGPWGTSYPANLRITAASRTEEEFVKYLKEFKTRPPMPYYNVNAMDENDLRSLYRYIKSLGEPGDPAPEAVPPDQEPKTPYYPLIPPTMPKS